MGRAFCHEGRGLLWARLAVLAWRGFFRARTVATARARTYTRISAAGREGFTDAEKISRWRRKRERPKS